MRVICLISFLMLCVGCESHKQYEYQPVVGLNFRFNKVTLAERRELNSVFLYSELSIFDDTKGTEHFNPGEIRGRLNGMYNSATYYSSIGSVQTQTVELKKGESVFPIYLVFPIAAGTDVRDFEIIEFGLNHTIVD